MNSIPIPIPVLGIPHFNRPDLLLRCLASIDYPVEHLVIIQNGEHKDMPPLVSVNHALEHLPPDFKVGQSVENYVRPVKQLTVIQHPNAGVAGAWNEIIKLFPAAWWLISNNDIEFAPGDLGRLAGHVELCRRGYQCPVCGNVPLPEDVIRNEAFCPACCPVENTRAGKFIVKKIGHGLFYGNHGASWFGITAECVRRAGLFDENLYPAYLEDCDYACRLRRLGITATDVPGVAAKHGDDQLTGSCTIHSDPALLQKNHRTHGRNFDYYRAKWGGINGEETFPTPFNVPGWPLWAWNFDPAFRAGQQW